ncbi:MAG: heavy-metal-associated domain-containing protein [Erysipelotrichia bacterium]|nr:heavy-metal-associated domain-containing protein [Bacilli bacterium]MDD4005619.1 heavy-metal-associated domain-containing protein [Bacilli bacterium]NMV82014.1 heavy-metal-associated domain-containing protein [Erysipelotrichia bacterium]
MKKTLRIEGMSCNHCVNHVKNALLEIEGIIDVEVNLNSKTAVVISKQDIDDSEFEKAIDEAGYKLTNVQ